jgi:hypothetical protein
MRKMCAFSYFLKSRLIQPAIDFASMQIAMRSQGNLAEDVNRAGVPACELNEEFDLPRRSVAKAGAVGGLGLARSRSVGLKAFAVGKSFSPFPEWLKCPAPADWRAPIPEFPGEHSGRPRLLMKLNRRRSFQSCGKAERTNDHYESLG